MLQARQPGLDGAVDDIGVYDCTAFGNKSTRRGVEADLAREVADYESAESQVANKNICARIASRARAVGQC